MLSCNLAQLDYFTPSVYKVWRIPPHPQPSIKCSLLPLRYGGASYSSPGRKPQSVGGKNSLLHPLSFLLLPPSKGWVRGRDILNLLDAMIHRVSFQKTHTQTSGGISAEALCKFHQHLLFKTLRRLHGWQSPFQLLGDNLPTNKFIKNGHQREKQPRIRNEIY